MSGIRQLRLVVHASEYEEAVHFFKDVLGAPVAEEYGSDDGAHVTILDVGRATLELSNDAQVELIDRVEVGRRVAPHLRVALEVDDCEASTREALAGGAEQIAPPTRTPWDSLNSRLHAPADIQLTLFQELGQAHGRLQRSVWASLVSDDAHALRGWLLRLGFTEDLLIPGERVDAIHHCQLDWPEGGRILLSSTGERPTPCRPGTASLHVVTADPDAVLARARELAATVVHEIVDQTDYPSRDFTVADPDGNHWTFATFAG